jgi:hypothetical protein
MKNNMAWELELEDWARWEKKRMKLDLGSMRALRRGLKDDHSL